MGARIYIASLGRFLSVDPLEGGVENNYVYAPDSVNNFDLTGEYASAPVPITIDTPISRWIDRHPKIAKTRDAIGFLMGMRKSNVSHVRTLPNGKVRTYGTISPAKPKGEMAGARKVQEVNVNTGKKRYWYETLDYNGRVRSVRPFDGKGYRHYVFDKNGKLQIKR